MNKRYPLIDFFFQILLPVILSIYFFITEFNSIIEIRESVAVTTESAPILFLRFFFAVILLPPVLIGDVLYYFGYIEPSPGSEYWQMKILSRAVYIILAIVGILKFILT